MEPMVFLSTTPGETCFICVQDAVKTFLTFDNETGEDSDHFWVITGQYDWPTRPNPPVLLRLVRNQKSPITWWVFKRKFKITTAQCQGQREKREINKLVGKNL
jgi:hypothetical protein